MPQRVFNLRSLRANLHHPQEESWPEIARRQFLLLEVAAMVKALESSGGLGPAVGAPGARPCSVLLCEPAVFHVSH